MLYVDTSAFVSMFVRESRSKAVVRFIEKRLDPIAISPWVLTETHSAISLKARTRALTPAEADEARARLSKAASRYLCESVVATDFDDASLHVARSHAALRAADALHLAICRRLGAELLSFDVQMNAAALELSIIVAAP